MEIEPIPPTTENIFSVKESKVTDGQSIYFKLPAAGVYTLTLTNKETGQVLSRERFTGKVGENIKKIYTNSIESQYLYLLLEDVTKTEIGKTTIITK
jgi:signal peptidase I